MKQPDWRPKEWMALSEQSFAKDWANELDAVYDRCRILYQGSKAPKRGRRHSEKRIALNL